MGFFENRKQKREEKARMRQELQAEMAAKREAEKRSTAILLGLNVEIGNAALRETERERSRDLSPHYRDQMVRQVSAKGQTLLHATTDMIGGGHLINQFLASHLGGTGEPGDFAIFCVYVAAVIKDCAELLETSRAHREYSVKSAGEGFIMASHKEIVTGVDTTLATSLRRAEEILSDWKNDPGDYLRRVLVTAVSHKGLQFAGPIATKALANLKTNASIKRQNTETQGGANGHD